MCLTFQHKNEIKEITINLPDAYLLNGHIFLDPEVKDNGILILLRKLRIIKNITGVAYYNYLSVPVALLNMGILRKYDPKGVSNYINCIVREGSI